MFPSFRRRSLSPQPVRCSGVFGGFWPPCTPPSRRCAARVPADVSLSPTTRPVNQDLSPRLNRPDSSPRARSGGPGLSSGGGETPLWPAAFPPAQERFPSRRVPVWLYGHAVGLAVTSSQTSTLFWVAVRADARVSIDRTPLHWVTRTGGGRPATRNVLAAPSGSCEGGWNVTRTRVGCSERHGRGGSRNWFLLTCPPRVGGGLPAAWRPEAPRRAGSACFPLLLGRHSPTLRLWRS